LNEDCGIYVRELGLVDARKKCEKELLGQVKGHAREFNGAFGDFWSELVAIRELSSDGYHRFSPIYKEQPDGTTADYEGYLGKRRAHIEVKNMRANETILDVFDREIHRLHKTNPSEFGFKIEVRYPYDKWHTAEQERKIRAFIPTLRGRQPPFEDSLDLSDAAAHIRVLDGVGTAYMTRGVGPTSPEPLSKDKFLAKVRDKADEASLQMRNSKYLKVPVINLDSPSGSISEDFVQDAKAIVRAAFSGDVQPYVLLYRYRV
jgi:hypothetical protein